MDLNKLLSELADEIDITDNQESDISRAYNGVADWLNQNGTDIAKYNIHIFPQGSMMYGTAIKPINEDDYDIDLVCEFRGNFNGLKPAYVKKIVGKRIMENQRYKVMLQPEGRRCWTLQYCDSLNFHMDILPAIPFSGEYYRADSRLNDAYNNISFRRDLALLATDKNKETDEYKYIPTNPRGYAEWFKEQTQKSVQKFLFDSVERVPVYPKKTVLQKAIQLLKRHRDVYFTSHNNKYKPISMIITTLVARCYSGESNLYEFICKALSNMTSNIERGNDGEYIIRNPVMDKENFADKWKETPQKATEFFDWIKNAYVDFVNLSDINTYSEIERTFKELFAQKPVDRLMKKYELYRQDERNKSIPFIKDDIYRSESQSKLEKISYRAKPTWILPKKFRVGIQGNVSYDNGVSYENFTSRTV